MESWKAPVDPDHRPIPPLSVTRMYREIEVAKEWGMLPWEFEALPADRKALLLAYFSVDNEIKSYYHKESMRPKKEGTRWDQQGS